MGTIKRNFYNNITPTGKFDSADLTGTIPADNIANASLTNVTSVPASVGDFVQKVASDPTPVGTGDVWYNTTSNALKSVVSSEAWSSGSPLSVSRNYVKGCGTQTAALTYSGYTGAPTTSTEEYNGSGWTTGGNMGAGAYSIQAYGTQTAAVQSGSYPNNADTEEYDGSAWTAGGNLNTGRGEGAGFGILTAGVVAGGFNPGPTSLSTVEHYDGTSYSSETSMSNARRADFGAAGIQTAGLAVSGPPSGTAVEEYDGTTWTAGGAHPSSLSQHCATGTQTDALVYGVGPPPAPTQTTKYDGTTWTVSPATLATGRRLAAGAGADGSSALLSGGYIDGPNVRTNLTEEYNVSTNVITPAAWASGGNLNTARNALGGAGTQTSGLAFGGSPTTGATEEYDGSTWTAGGSLGTSRYYVGGSGTLTAGLAVGGRAGPGPNFALTNTEEYDGSSWTAGGALPTANNGMHTSGIQTAGLAWGGISSPGAASSTATYEYDGSAWTSGGTLPAGVRYGMGAGTQTASLSGGGDTGGTTFTYDGSTWSDQAPSVMLTQSKSPIGFFAGAFGTQTSAIAAGGRNAPGEIKYATSQGWDGSVWSTSSNLATARGYGMSGSIGTTTAGLVAGGQGDAPTYPNISATEEFTGETSSANIVEITTS